MNIFIAGLNYNMSEAELGELFAEYGEVVSVKIIMDRETGRSKGYGFVEMADDEAGDKAIAALNEVDMDGKGVSEEGRRGRGSSAAFPRDDVGHGVVMATMVVVIVVVTTVVVVATVVVAETMAMEVAETDINLYLYKI